MTQKNGQLSSRHTHIAIHRVTFGQDQGAPEMKEMITYIKAALLHTGSFSMHGLAYSTLHAVRS